MKMEPNETNVRSLPEDRQGTSGADAGRDSERAIGGRRLNRRAATGLPEELTAEGKTNNHNLNVPPAEGVLADANQLTTKEGKTRQRIKWTEEMNKNVIRCYMKSTLAETNMTAYRNQMHRMFIHLYPELAARITEQNITDRKRAIIAKSMIPTKIIEEIKEQVRRELNIGTETEEENDTDEMEHEIIEADVPHSEETETEEQQNEDDTEARHKQELLEKIEKHFQTALIEFTGTDPLSRPNIPKAFPSVVLNQTLEIMNNTILRPHTDECNDLETLHLLVYCAAISTVRTLQLKIRPQGDGHTRYNKNANPPWMIRLKKRIAALRAKIARLTQYKRNVRSKKLVKLVGKIVSPMKLDEMEGNTLNEIIDKHTQQLAAYAKRLRRYKECTDRKQQNNEFHNNQKKFYRNLNKNNITYTEGIPSIDSVRNFWADIWEKPKQHEVNNKCLQEERMRIENINEMNETPITEHDITDTIKKTSNWKSPGPDQIQNYWYKKLPVVHSTIARLVNSALEDPTQMPNFLTTGNTYLLPKDNNTANPSKYRPITCLPTLYKMITSVITAKIQRHLDKNNIMTEEQKGCYKKSKGCKDQIVIDAILVNQAIKRRRNLNMAYIDYKKAFDSVPHSYLIEILEVYKVDVNVVRFLKHSMSNWSTSLHIYDGQQSNNTGKIHIKNGIFQGDALSALWFCMCLNPLSQALNSSQLGFSIKNKHKTDHTTSHLLYMDDLKLYANSTDQLRQLLNITKEFSKSIHMEFGLDKCKTITIQKGDLTNTQRFEVDDNQIIEGLGEEDNYKYLGVLQLKGINHTKIKEKLTADFERRIHEICKTLLNFPNKIKAINTYAIPILTYSFGIIKWSKTDLDNLSRLIRVIMTKHRMHHPKSAIERMSLPQEMGGMGILDISQQNQSQIKSLRQYFHAKADQHTLFRAICQADVNATPLQLCQIEFDPEEHQNSNQNQLQKWKRKEIHGTHPHHLYQETTDTIASNLFMKQQLFGETVGFMCAIQDRVILTKNYRKHIIKEKNVLDKCRRCGINNETIEHIMAGCNTLTGFDYTERHNNVAKIVHQQLARKFKLIEEEKPYYKYEPITVLENNYYKLYWDREIRTDIKINANRPDIVVYNKKKNEVDIIDVAIPLSHNLQATYATKINKYLELAAEIKQMWKVKSVKIYPLTISTTTIVPKTFTSNLNKLNILQTLPSIVKSVVLDTCHIVRRFLSID